MQNHGGIGCPLLSRITLIRRNHTDNNLFDDLVSSIKQAGAIKGKEIQASRVTELELPDIK